MQEAKATTSSSLEEFTINVPPRLSYHIDEGPCAGGTVHPKGFWVSVGRTRASRLYVKDGSVSERHAEICWSGHHWLLRDTGSSNSTVYNGRRLTPMVDVVQLNHNDRVQFGDSKGRILLEQQCLSAFTVEELILAQYEVMAQAIEAKAQCECKSLLTHWSMAKEELQGGVA